MTRFKSGEQMYQQKYGNCRLLCQLTAKRFINHTNYLAKDKLGKVTAACSVDAKMFLMHELSNYGLFQEHCLLDTLQESFFHFQANHHFVRFTAQMSMAASHLVPFHDPTHEPPVSSAVSSSLLQFCWGQCKKREIKRGRKNIKQKYKKTNRSGRIITINE